MNSLEKIWARATGHLMGNTDDDRPDVPILTLREARIALFLKTSWIGLHVISCFFIFAKSLLFYVLSCLSIRDHFFRNCLIV